MTAQTPESSGPAASRRLLRRRRALGAACLVTLPFLLGACQVPNFFGYRGSTTQAQSTFKLYAGLVITSIIVGGIVFGLILWAVFRYRRRSDDMPRQFQYHVPLEIAYTVIPLLIVIGIFIPTVFVENTVNALAAKPAETITVTAFQWGWDFRYDAQNIEILGHTLDDPALVVPSGQPVQINLQSNDVIHGFYVPQFNFSRYAQPGVLNQFNLTVIKPGDYPGQCTQLCGLYHSLMIFHVVAVTPAQFQAWLARNKGSTLHPMDFFGKPGAYDPGGILQTAKGDVSTAALNSATRKAKVSA